MARTKQSKSKHDALVKQIAKKLDKQGYQVQADVTGFAQPKTIGGYRPDVIAKKGTERKIIEVETPDSLNTTRDKSQQQAFKAAADRSKNTDFQRRVAK